MPKNETLLFDESKHCYRLMPSGTILPSVTQVIDSVFPFIDRGEVTDRAKRFGSVVHRAIELEIKSILDWKTVDESIVPYLNQLRLIEPHLNIILQECKTEQMLWSKKYRFSGRIDLVENRCIDIKTGQKSATHRYQGAAYRHLWQNTYKVRLPKTLIIYLDGSDKLPEMIEEQPQDFNTFLACLEIYNAKKKEGIK